MTDSDLLDSPRPFDNVSSVQIPTPTVQRLPVLLPRPHPHQPIRAIDADTFTDYHLAHLTSDVPDSVLFPFLHGLEGDNLHQNSFFAASSGLDLGPRRSTLGGANETEDGSGAEREGAYAHISRVSSPNVVKVPEYRGLVWVACDEDELQSDGHAQTQDIDLDDDEDFDFEYDEEYEQGESEEDDDAYDHGELMQVDDVEVNAGATQLDTPPESGHMHPEALRKPLASAPIAIQTGPHFIHNHTSFFTAPFPAPSSSHHHNAHAHVPHSSSDEAGPDPGCERRLSTSSITTSESTSSSASTSASDSTHSHFEFSASESYSTTASSVGQLKDFDADVDASTDCDSASPTAFSPTGTDSTALTTPCTSPATDIAIDDCIPTVAPETPFVKPSAPPLPPKSSSATSTTTVSTNKPSSYDPSATISVSTPATESGPFDDKGVNDMIEELKHLTITSSFRSNDLLTTDSVDGGPIFVAPRVPDGISLRNFGIQVPIYATLSDIVVYSANATPGAMRAAFALAEKFKIAVERKAAERKQRYEAAGVEVVWVRQGGLGQAVPAEEKDVVKIIDVIGNRSREESEDAMDVEDGGLNAHAKESLSSGSGRPRAYLVAYNVFVLTDPLHVLARKAPWMVSRLSDSTDQASTGNVSNSADTSSHLVGRKETGASEPIAPTKSDGTSNDSTAEHSSKPTITPTVDFGQRERDEMRELTKTTAILGDCVYLGNASDVPLPSLPPARLGKSAKSDLVKADKRSANGYSEDAGASSSSGSSAEKTKREEGEVEEDPFDSSSNPMGYDVCIECRDPASLPSPEQLRAAEAHLATLDAHWSARSFAQESESSSTSSTMFTSSLRPPRPAPSASHIVHLTFPASPPCFAYTMWHLTPFLNFISGLVAPRQHPPSTRPKRVLIYSSDGYTESSVLALCVLMKERGLDLPGAYLELQVDKGRSFFVYQSDIGVLKRVESQLEKERTALTAQPSFRSTRSTAASPSPGRGERHDWTRSWNGIPPNSTRETGASHPYARSPRNSISYHTSAMHEAAPSAPPVVVPSQGHGEFSSPAHVPLPRRQRAQTSPFLPPHVDHQTWFNDPRFDGSFPSRVLPFLYLGNLNHAQNAYMLHALGITHVVSVGECALVPPSNIATGDSPSGYHLVAGRGPGGHGSLWMEEREGRMKVLDIKGVCDDGIDSLEHQLAPICEWMERARQEGGTILVHCRVGVSRSATVTIAYVMKHLELSLVDAYLIVRSRRLNVLIQPNMRLLYNLCGWEVELARERAKGDINKLRHELSRSLNWPFLAREVHRLNEKYLH